VLDKRAMKWNKQEKREIFAGKKDKHILYHLENSGKDGQKLGIENVVMYSLTMWEV
jgi:hypothetical protein